MKTKEELNALKEEIDILNKKLSQLTVEELEHVSGGSVIDDFLQWISSDMGYKSGATPKFSCGQQVTFYDLNTWQNGEIVRIDSRNAGLINTEFSYTVKDVNSKTVSGIYESNIKVR